MMEACLDNPGFLRRSPGVSIHGRGMTRGEEKATITSQWYLQMISEVRVPSLYIESSFLYFSLILCDS